MSNTNEQPSVCVMGLGTVGLPTARYIQQQGYQLVGYDISRTAVERARNWIEATTEIREIPQDTDVFVVCVSTKQSGGRPDASYVFDACSKITNFSPRLVSVESTVPIGTCRELVDTVFDGDAHVAHAPHRYWPEDSANHGVRQLRVVGAVDSESMSQAKNFYDDLGIPLLEVEPIEIAEMAKITENAYRYVQIAFAEELRLICQRNHIDFNHLRNACNSKWNTYIPEARDGIGGTCLPKDILYVVEAARKSGLEPDLLTSAILADKKYVETFKEPYIAV